MENKIQQNNADFYPKLFIRYIDNIFYVFSNEISSNKILDLLYKQQKNIKVTVKHEFGTLIVLYVEVTLTKFGIKTKIYIKYTHTNSLLNFDVICPIKRKSGLIVCLLNRAKIVCSGQFCFKKKLKNLSQCLKKIDIQVHFL